MTNDYIKLQSMFLSEAGVLGKEKYHHKTPKDITSQHQQTAAVIPV